MLGRCGCRSRQNPAFGAGTAVVGGVPNGANGRSVAPFLRCGGQGLGKRWALAPPAAGYGVRRRLDGRAKTVRRHPGGQTLSRGCVFGNQCLRRRHRRGVYCRSFPGFGTTELPGTSGVQASPTSTGRTRRHSVDPVFLMAARMRRRGSEAVSTTGMVKLDVRVPRLRVSCLPPASRLRLDCSVSIPYGDGDNRGLSNPRRPAGPPSLARPALAPACSVGRGGSLNQHVIDAVEIGVPTAPGAQLAEAI